MWKYYALLSAVFAALTAILAKVGVRDIDSNLATAIRTTVILAITWGVVLATGIGGKLRELTGHNLLFLVLSGIATGSSTSRRCRPATPPESRRSTSSASRSRSSSASSCCTNRSAGM